MNLRKLFTLIAVIAIFLAFLWMVMHRNVAGEIACVMLMAVLVILVQLTRSNARR
jgi:hypothetical protein